MARASRKGGEVARVTCYSAAAMRCSCPPLSWMVTALATVACTVDFPERKQNSDALMSSPSVTNGVDGPGFPATKPDVERDGGPEPTEGGHQGDASLVGPPRRDAQAGAGDVGLGTAQDALLPDGPDAGIPGPPVLVLTVDGGDEVPAMVTNGACVPAEVRLSWSSRRATACTLTQQATLVSEALAGDGALAGLFTRDVTFTLKCRGPGGTASVLATAHVRPGLEADVALDRDASRDLQAACAGRHGQRVYPDAFPTPTAETAAQLCRCAGYGQVDLIVEFDGEPNPQVRCFSHPTGNEVSRWNPEAMPDGNWEREDARDANQCIGRLICNQPVERCADLY